MIQKLRSSPLFLHAFAWRSTSGRRSSCVSSSSDWEIGSDEFPDVPCLLHWDYCDCGLIAAAISFLVWWVLSMLGLSLVPFLPIKVKYIHGQAFVTYGKEVKGKTYFVEHLCDHRTDRRTAKCIVEFTMLRVTNYVDDRNGSRTNVRPQIKHILTWKFGLHQFTSPTDMRFVEQFCGRRINRTMGFHEHTSIHVCDDSASRVLVMQTAEIIFYI